MPVKRMNYVGTRLPPADQAALQRIATAAGTTPCGVIRRLVQQFLLAHRKKVVNTRPDTAEAPPRLGDVSTGPT